MTYDDFLKLYKERKKQEKNYDFLGTLLKEIRPRYLREAAALGKDPNQSWNSWSGNTFERIVTEIIKDFIADSDYKVGMTSSKSLGKTNVGKKLDKVKRNLLVFYNDFAVLPDADIVLFDRQSLLVIAILSCKASLRERVAQSAYWKIKLQSAETTKEILCYLASTDNDGDFVIENNERTRNRIIVEFGEIDAAYILRDIQRSEKVKNFNEIFADLTVIFQKWYDAKPKSKTKP